MIALLSRTLTVDPAQRPASPRELLAELETCRAQLTSPNESPSRRAGRKWVAALLLAALLAGALVALRRQWQKVAPPALPDKSIAVLPFENRSEDKQDIFFADGIQDDVLTSLVKIKELKVIGRSSIVSYRDTHQRNLRQIGERLGVSHLLEGSVRRVAERVLIQVHLTDTRDGRAIWAERYDRTPADSIGLQGEVAIEIAVALRTKLAPAEKTRLSEKPTNNPEAYALYLKGLAYDHGAAGKEDIIAAERLYVQAVAS